MDLENSTSPHRGLFLVEKAVWDQNRCLLAEKYCMLVNELVWLNSKSAHLGSVFGVRALTEMKIRCVEGMYNYAKGV